MQQWNWKRWLSYVLVAAVSSALTLGFARPEPLTAPNQSKLEQLEQLILDSHVKSPDKTVLEDGAAVGMIAATGDRWSYYISAQEYEFYENSKKNAYVGIGVTVDAKDTSQGLRVLRVEAKGSAGEAGILAGDYIVGVDGLTLETDGADAIKNAISGQEGTTLELAVRRGEEILKFTLQRRQLVSEVASAQMLPGNIGYVKIVNFNEKCADQTIASIDDLLEQGAEKLIFDVRHNGGGFKSEMVRILDYLLPEGDLFHTLDHQGNKSVDTSDANCLRMPMAVLVNAESYSAAEFFAAALQEYDWATVIGTQTSGKGYYQYTIQLNDGSAVALSMGQYFTPKGVSLAEVGGVRPDVTVEVDDETAAGIAAQILTVSEDPQILAAIAAVEKESGK